MSDLPILFSAPMVLAHIEARKSQTRRLLTPRMVRFFDGHGKSWQPSWEQLVLALEEAADFRRVDGSTWTWTAKAAPHQHAERTHWMADLHVAPGDRLWIRETWRTGVSLDAHKPTEIEKMVKEAGYRKPWCPVQYEADKASVGSVADFGGDWGKTRVAIHMPRWLSRLTDTVTDVRVQRLQEISEHRQKAEREKNLPGEIDRDTYSLQRYLELAAEGQTVALDILFAPEWAMTEVPQPEWQEIARNRPRLLTRKSAAFLGYCRQQANKYGIKGSRVAAARNALALLADLEAKHGTTPKLREFATEVEALVGEHSALIDIELANGNTIRHWDVCGRKMPFTTSVKTAREIMQRLVDEYGQRALQAEQQQGIDWKALSHAVRVGNQALELLRTGHVTFPLPNAAHVLEIKKGERPYQEVGAEIERLLEEVEAAAEVSPLPAEPDHAWIADFVAEIHRREVCRAS